ncbi:hypothetical protein D3C72_2201890 [compost metagenome]
MIRVVTEVGAGQQLADQPVEVIADLGRLGVRGVQRAQHRDDGAGLRGQDLHGTQAARRFENCLLI